MRGSAAKRRAAAASLSFVAMAAAATHPARHVPRALSAFLDRHAECHHFAGEDTNNEARARDIGQAETRLRCDRLEADERALRRRYAGRWPLLKLLDAADGED